MARDAPPNWFGLALQEMCQISANLDFKPIGTVFASIPHERFNDAAGGVRFC
jgi:hypothetical protein